MLFHFQLRSLADITPWGSPERLYLHWFGLTEGWYWLQMNESNELFRCSTELLTYWRKSYPEETIASPYVDYYVVRLWEDLLAILPDILEPLPGQLVQMLETEEQASRWEKRSTQWEEKITEREELGTDIWDAYMEATAWWGRRKLDTGYLTAPPHLWFWSDGTCIHCFWDNRHVFLQDLPAWEAQRGSIQLTHIQFLEEVHSFHARFLSMMEERIQQVKSSWLRPDVALDIVALEKEHQDRSQWLARSLERAASRNVTPWKAVLEAMEVLERRFEFPQED